MDIITIYRHTIPLFMLTTDEDDFLCMGGDRITISKMEVAMPTEANINSLLKIDENGTYVAKYRLYNPFKENVFKGEPLILKRLSTAASVTSSYLMMLLIDKLLYGLLHITPNDMSMELETLYSALAPYKGKNKSTTIEVLYKGWLKKAEVTMSTPATSVLPIKLGKGVKYKEKTLSAALLFDGGYSERYSENENIKASLGVIYGYILGNIYKESIIAYSDNSNSPGYISLVRGMYKLANMIKSVNQSLSSIEESYGNNQLTLELNTVLSAGLPNIIDELEAVPTRYKLGIDIIPAIDNDGYVDKRDKEVNGAPSKRATHRVSLPDEPNIGKNKETTKAPHKEDIVTRDVEKYEDDGGEDIIEITNMDQVHKHLFKPPTWSNNKYRDEWSNGSSNRGGRTYYSNENRDISVFDRLRPTRDDRYDTRSQNTNGRPVYPGRRSSTERIAGLFLKWDPDVGLHFDEEEEVWVDTTTGEVFDIYMTPIRGNNGGSNERRRQDNRQIKKETIPSRRATVEMIEGVPLLWDPEVRLHFDEKTEVWVDINRGVTYNTFMEEIRSNSGGGGGRDDRRSRTNGITLPA